MGITKCILVFALSGCVLNLALAADDTCDDLQASLQRTNITSQYSAAQPIAGTIAKTVFDGAAGLFLPTDDALGAVVKMLLSEASVKAKANITSLPKGINQTAILTLPAMADLYKYHLIESGSFEENVLPTFDTKQGAKSDTIEVKTQLKSTDKLFCPKGPETTVKYTGYNTSADGFIVSVQGAGNANAVNTTGDLLEDCEGLWIVPTDTVLLPCSFNDSILPSLVTQIAGLYTNATTLNPTNTTASPKPPTASPSPAPATKSNAALPHFSKSPILTVLGMFCTMLLALL